MFVAGVLDVSLGCSGARGADRSAVRDAAVRGGEAESAAELPAHHR